MKRVYTNLLKKERPRQLTLAGSKKGHQELHQMFKSADDLRVFIEEPAILR